jgi:hypothetical protein
LSQLGSSESQLINLVSYPIIVAVVSQLM